MIVGNALHLYYFHFFFFFGRRSWSDDNVSVSVNLGMDGRLDCNFFFIGGSEDNGELCVFLIVWRSG